MNKRKHDVYELALNETEAAVVRIVFDKYVHEGYGAQRIATYLNNQGYRARSGKMWHHATIRGILCNLTYTGLLRSGKSRSPVLPHLQIIESELFEAAQRIRTNRANESVWGWILWKSPRKNKSPFPAGNRQKKKLALK